MPRNPKYGPAHQRARAAGLKILRPGTLCARCRHPLWPSDRIDLDHDDHTGRYLGFSHSSPCQTCGSRCNQQAGGQKAALAAGRQLRENRRCVICGRPYTAARGRTSATQVTCGQRACIAALQASRRDRNPDPQPPPPPAGRAWLNRVSSERVTRTAHTQHNTQATGLR